MDPSDIRPSPRRELQGPRPTPLKLHKDSYKIKKPPLAPAAAPPRQHPQSQPQHRDPVIIYAVSPKIIHTNPSDFMMIVQRLTGSSSSSTSYDPSLPSPSHAAAGGALSPAAKFATFEKTARSPEGMNQMDIMEVDHRPQGLFPGILSPMPSSLPPISPNLFSLSDPGFLSFLHDLSPAAAAAAAAPSSSNKGFADNTFLISPSSFLTTPTIPSPGAYWELFNQLLD